VNVRWVVVADGERRQVQLAIGGGGHVAVGDRVGDGSDRDLARPNDDRERPRIGPRSVGRRDPNGRGDGRGAREQELSAFTPASARGEQRLGGRGGRRQLKQTLYAGCALHAHDIATGSIQVQAVESGEGGLAVKEVARIAGARRVQHFGERGIAHEVGWRAPYVV